MAPARRPRGRCHDERDQTALVAASGPRGGEPGSVSVHRRRGVGGRDIGRSGSPTPMIRPATAGVRSYRAGIRRGAVSVEMGRSRTSCSSTWARSPPTSRPSWPRSASLPAALIRRRSTKPASTAAVGADNCVVAGQAAFRYSLMGPSQRAVFTAWRCLSGWSGGSVATGGRWSSERWGRCVL